jgi:GT2 family glycosyltransferase
VDSDGRPQAGFTVRRLPTPSALILESLLLNRIWPGNPINRRYRCLEWDYSARSEAEQPAGAFLMVRRAIWQELGGLDERFYPIWFEDVDFCCRIRGRGYRLYYVPEAQATHAGGHSIPHLTVEMRLVYWYCSLLRYAAKHFRPVAFRAVCLAVVTGSIFRSIAETVWHRSLQPMAAYAKVVRFAGRGLLFGSLG